jgi:glycosyltransferase involved in cell wall biosynthesis
MNSEEIYKSKFDALQVCILIPTYNNQSTIAGVISDVSAYCNNVIVVNDGSTDETPRILKSFPNIKLVSFKKNVGKGWALRKGLAYAVDLGYKYAISIDSDGQHFAKDLPQFLKRLETVQDAIIIGARNMDQASVPGKSSFGNKFSNFWFKVETGITLPDTQSGYRLYPLLPLKGMHFVTRKFEFEIEVLVRAAWKGVTIDSVPVKVYYAPKETRVSHFRPFQDFTRISILNTFLVIIAFLYIKPRDFFRAIFQKKKFRQIINDHLFNPHQSAELKAASIALGVFMGIIPIWGFQLVAAIFLAILFKLNKALVIIAANISIPPMIPVIIFLSIKAGAYWMGSNGFNIDFSKSITIESVSNNLKQYIYGSITLAIIAGCALGLLSYIMLKVFKRKSIAGKLSRR